VIRNSLYQEELSLVRIPRRRNPSSRNAQIFIALKWLFYILGLELHRFSLLSRLGKAFLIYLRNSIDSVGTLVLPLTTVSDKP